MAVVQAWEANLAVLVGVLRLKPSSGRPVVLEDDVRRSLRRSWSLLNHTTASKLKMDLEEMIDGEIVTTEFVEGVTALVKWRDLLAHRYLRTRVVGQTGYISNPAIVVELFQIGQAFSAWSRGITEMTREALQRVPKPEAPQELTAILAELALQIATEQPAPFGTKPPDPE